MKISAHILVKNEERFIWYSIMSVIDYVDKIRIWSVQSTDQTNRVIDEISRTKSAIDKEIFEFKKIKNSFDEEKMRGDMLKADLNSDTDWILVVDGDEIWWEESIRNVVGEIRNHGNHIESIVVPTYNLVGDLYHYQEEKAGRYHLAGREGHLALRAINCQIPGLTAKGEHGVFSWFDTPYGGRIEEWNQSKIIFLDAPYLHATHLKRSVSDENVYKRKKKLKYEIGKRFPLDFYFPEALFRTRPSIVPSIWQTTSFSFKLRAFLETPIKKIYRRTLLPFRKYGY